MRRIARENALCALVALLACAAIAYLGLKSFVWSDYEHEVAPAFAALLDGHLGEFLRLAPAYGGSLIERAPFALLAGLCSGGSLAVYRAVALPCLLAVALLGVWLVARMRAEGAPLTARTLALLVCVANPMTLRALEIGHPEEILGACLCVAAVSAAGGQRPLWAGFALGLAVANKEWALLAAGPVLLALAPRRRLPCAAVALAVAGGVLAPLALVHAGSFLARTRATASTGGGIFEPSQLWWFFGAHTSGAAALQASRSRVGPAWIAAISHPSILAFGLLLGLALWFRERRTGSIGARSALLALALLLLARCLLDTWDTSYYTLPFLLALLAWEARCPPGRLPLLAAASTALASITFLWLSQHASDDLQAVFFLGWAVPLAALLAVHLFAPNAIRRVVRRFGSAPTPAQEITVSAFPRPLSTS